MSLTLVVHNPARLGRSVAALAQSQTVTLDLKVDNTARDERRQYLVQLVSNNPGDLFVKSRMWARKIKPGQYTITFSWRKNRCRVRHADHEGEWTVLLEFLDAAGEPELFVSWLAEPGHPLLGIPLFCQPEDSRQVEVQPDE